MAQDENHSPVRVDPQYPHYDDLITEQKTIGRRRKRTAWAGIVVGGIVVSVGMPTAVITMHNTLSNMFNAIAAVALLGTIIIGATLWILQNTPMFYNRYEPNYRYWKRGPGIIFPGIMPWEVDEALENATVINPDEHYGYDGKEPTVPNRPRK